MTMRGMITREDIGLLRVELFVENPDDRTARHMITDFAKQRGCAILPEDLQTLAHFAFTRDFQEFAKKLEEAALLN